MHERNKTKQTPQDSGSPSEGIIPINKPRGLTSFSLVRLLRKHLGVRKIGHAGTLDPFASGVMVMLVGRKYTRMSDLFLNKDKEYVGRILLGIATDTFDCDGKILTRSDIVPKKEDVERVVSKFQGKIQQIPPMFSAKKLNGKKLYELARKGIDVEREPVTISVEVEILDYTYPHLDIRVSCSKGTYIRTIAHDIGADLGCGGHLCSLTRTKSGSFTLANCFDGEKLQSPEINVEELYEKLLETEQYNENC